MRKIFLFVYLMFSLTIGNAQVKSEDSIDIGDGVQIVNSDDGKTYGEIVTKTINCSDLYAESVRVNERLRPDQDRIDMATNILNSDSQEVLLLTRKIQASSCQPPASESTPTPA